MLKTQKLSYTLLRYNDPKITILLTLLFYVGYKGRIPGKASSIETFDYPFDNPVVKGSISKFKNEGTVYEKLWDCVAISKYLQFVFHPDKFTSYRGEEKEILLKVLTFVFTEIKDFMRDINAAEKSELRMGKQIPALFIEWWNVKGL